MIKTGRTVSPLLLTLVFAAAVTAAWACERVKPADKTGAPAPGAAVAMTPEPAMTAVAPPADPKPVTTPPAAEPKGTFYFKVDFKVLRGLAVVQANVPKFRELAQKQGFMGRLIACGADPFTTLDHLTAVLPPKVRKNPGGAVTISGEFDAAKVIACLEGEFLKEQFTVETEGQTRWLKSPRMTLSLSSPGEKQVRGGVRGWDKLDFTEELNALVKRLPAGYGLLVGAVGDIFPMNIGMKTTLMSFAPAGESLELSGLLLFANEAMATGMHGALTSSLNARKKAAENSTDPKMQLAATLLGRLNIVRTGAELGVSANVPYGELVQSLGLFQFKIKGTL